MRCLKTGLEVNYPCSPVCPLFGDCTAAFNAQQKARVKTKADRIRAMSDEELMAGLYLLYRLTMEQDGGDIARHWCDGKSGCTNEYGEIECNEERHKACILRWLQQPAEEVDT